MLMYRPQGRVNPRPITGWREIPEETETEHKIDCLIAYLLGVAGGAIAIISLLF